MLLLWKRAEEQREMLVFMEKYGEEMKLFHSNNNKIDTILIENLQKEIKNLKEITENLQKDLKKVDLKYMNWLEEKELWIKELRDKIQKKVDYINKKEESLDMKELYKNKIISKFMPKSNNFQTRRLTEQEKKDLNIS